MKTSPLLLLSIFTVFSMPFFAHAHASPIDYQPQSSEQLADAPKEVRIRFSERVEQGASRIIVADESGASITEGEAQVDAQDAHFLSVPVRAADDGTYFVTWSVVSSDDGHFTKGGYAYFIGTAATGTAQSVPQVQVVQLSATPEATAIFVELLGNSFLWGILILFAFVLRKIFLSADDNQRKVVRHVFDISVSVGVFLILAGAATHVVLKTLELADLHALKVFEALPLYLATVSGSATVIRACAGLAFGIIYLLRRKSILAAERTTWSEIVLFLVLGVFAFFRAKVSHATANPFFPELSVTVNFLHLIGKDLWAGLIGVLSILYLSRVVRPLMTEILQKSFGLLSIIFGIAGASATYIVWLHLKDFGNITTTLWGERFILLLGSAVLAFALLVYHIVGNKIRPDFVSRYLPYTLPGEFAAGALVVFFSSLMIITSPPIEEMHAKVFTTESNGLTITLERSRFEDGKALLSITGGKDGEVIQDPTVMLGTEGGLVLDTERRFNGGYVFPLSVFMSGMSHPLEITVPQNGAYDARASFSVNRAELDPGESGSGRRFDVFTLVMIAIGLASVAFAFLMHRFSRESYHEPSRNNSPLRYVVGFCGALIIASQIIGIGHWAFANEYKKECVADLNGWHIMLPTKNGMPVSSTPREGCMALGGSFHLPDPREYRFLKMPGETKVEFSNDFSVLKTGVPVSLNFSILDQDNNPVLLSVQHERIVHFIVASSDMKEFYHIHPEDFGKPSAESVRTATFSIPFTFKRAGDYVLAVDYAHGLTLQSKFVKVTVAGTPQQESKAETYQNNGTFDGYEVSIDYSQPMAGEVSNLLFEVKKDGKKVMDLQPYLGAAMHVAVIKNDLSEFVHTHGEVHPPGVPVPPVTKTTAHVHNPPPPRFGPPIDAHPIFPTAGLYTVFGQFMHQGKVIVTKFTVRVEE